MQEGHVGACRRERRGAIECERCSLDVAQPEMRQAEVGPCRRFDWDELGGARECRLRVIEKAHLKRGEPAVELARRLLINR
jgi:hypothetical protein